MALVSVRIQQLKCPNCGAPLGVPSERGFSVCIYCTATSHVAEGRVELAADTERTISPAQMEEIRALLLSGKKSEAAERYAKLCAVELREAEEVIASMSSQLELRVLLSRPLNAMGVTFVLFVVALLAASIWLVTSGFWPRYALFGTVLVTFLCYPFFNGLWVTLRYLGARAERATVLHSVDVGPMKGGKAHVFKLLIEVYPANESAFRAEVVVPVRTTNLAHVQPGALVRARYFAGDTTRVICERA